MDKDRIAGAAKESTGTIKEATGKVLGDATRRRHVDRRWQER